MEDIYHNPDATKYCDTMCSVCGRDKEYYRGKMFKFLECGCKKRYDGLEINKDWKILGSRNTSIHAKPYLTKDEPAIIYRNNANEKIINDACRKMNIDFNIFDYNTITCCPCGHDILNNHFIGLPNSNKVVCLGSECVNHFIKNKGVEKLKCVKCGKGQRSKDDMALCAQCGKYCRNERGKRNRFSREKQIKRFKKYLKEDIQNEINCSLNDFTYKIYKNYAKFNKLKPEGIKNRMMKIYNEKK